MWMKKATVVTILRHSNLVLTVFENIKIREAQIDQMVYALYGLTADEIAIVQGHSKAD